MRVTLPWLDEPLDVAPLTLLTGAAPEAGRALWEIHRLSRLLSWDLSATPASPIDEARIEHLALASRIERAVATMIDALGRSSGVAELRFAFDRDELAGGLSGEAALRSGGATLSLDARELSRGCAHAVALRLRPETGSILADLHDHRGRGRLSGRLLLGSVREPSRPSAWAPELERVLHVFVRWIAGTAAALPQDRRLLAASYPRLGPEHAALSPPGAASFCALLRAAESVGSDPGDAIPRELRSALADGPVGGRLGFSHASPPITWSPADGVQVPLHEAPAIVGALAGLDLYLRCFAGAGDVVVIEEPEIALDAPARREVAAALAALARAGVRVVIGSASGGIHADLALPGAEVVVHAFRAKTEETRGSG